MAVSGGVDSAVAAAHPTRRESDPLFAPVNHISCHYGGGFRSKGCSSKRPLLEILEMLLKLRSCALWQHWMLGRDAGMLTC